MIRLIQKVKNNSKNEIEINSKFVRFDLTPPLEQETLIQHFFDILQLFCELPKMSQGKHLSIYSTKIQRKEHTVYKICFYGEKRFDPLECIIP